MIPSEVAAWIDRHVDRTGALEEVVRDRHGEAELERARDAYLAEFADVAPHAELVETLELACRAAKIARTLTWERALRAAREQCEPIDSSFADAPAETLAGLLDPSYLA